MQDIVDAIFPRNCAAEETWKNEQTTGKQVHCIFQKGHWGEELAQFADDAESLGCNVSNILLLRSNLYQWLGSLLKCYCPRFIDTVL